LLPSSGSEYDEHAVVFYGLVGSQGRSCFTAAEGMWSHRDRGDRPGPIGMCDPPKPWYPPTRLDGVMTHNSRI
jgi:hypothetical protein